VSKRSFPKPYRYKVKCPGMYIGNPNDAWVRSSWERTLMLRWDCSPSVERWGSEPFHIWYRSPIDGQKHRYFIDFVVIMKSPEGERVVNLIEVKPHAQCFPPRGGKNKRRLILETKTYLVNQAKWHAAKRHADEKGWVFRVVTEKGTYSADQVLNQDYISS
jgi:hypothetical protein